MLNFNANFCFSNIYGRRRRSGDPPRKGCWTGKTPNVLQLVVVAVCIHGLRERKRVMVFPLLTTQCCWRFRKPLNAWPLGWNQYILLAEKKIIYPDACSCCFFFRSFSALIFCFCTSLVRSLTLLLQSRLSGFFSAACLYASSALSNEHAHTHTRT